MLNNSFEESFTVFSTGAPLVPHNSWTDFMFTRTFSTLNVIESPPCDVC